MLFIPLILSRVVVVQPGRAARQPQLLLGVVGQRGLHRGGRRKQTTSRAWPLHRNRAARVKHSSLSHAATVKQGTLRQREGLTFFAI